MLIVFTILQISPFIIKYIVEYTTVKPVDKFFLSVFIDGVLNGNYLYTIILCILFALCILLGTLMSVFMRNYD
jgi:hypothetical protein